MSNSYLGYVRELRAIEEHIISALKLVGYDIATKDLDGRDLDDLLWIHDQLLKIRRTIRELIKECERLSMPDPDEFKIGLTD